MNLTLLDEILINAEHSKNYRPTLYDFLAHNALDFYCTNEGGLSQFKNDFDLDNPRYFDGIEQMELPRDSLSPTVNAIEIFRDLLDFHKTDTDPLVYVKLELERLQFLVDEGTLKEENELYKAALLRLRSAYLNNALSAQIDFELATLLSAEGDQYAPASNTEPQFKKKEALSLCDDAIKRFSDSDGSEKCRILREHITRQTISLTAEKHVPIDTYSRVRIEYRNIENLSFGIYKITADFLDRFFHHLNDSARTAEVARMTADTTWQVSLPNRYDYQEHSTEIAAPPLSGGTYLLLSRVNGAASVEDGIFAYTSIQVTNLALAESSLDNNRNRYQVVDRNTGATVGRSRCLSENKLGRCSKCIYN